MRSKEDAMDYRYFPTGPAAAGDRREWVETIARDMPELPGPCASGSCAITAAGVRRSY